MKPRQATPLPWVTVGVLGLVTIIAYGVAYYSYGVLVDPIKAGTHWSSTALGAIFSAVLVISGIGGLAGGRLVDRLGTRPAFLIAGTRTWSPVRRRRSGWPRSGRCRARTRPRWRGFSMSCARRLGRR